MLVQNTAEIAARMDRLPASRAIWLMITLISFGGLFEGYDLFLTGYVAPGLAKAGLFTSESLGIWNVLGPTGVTGVGTFVFATFAGLFVGTIGFGWTADRFGRRSVFTWSLIWYSVSNIILAFQQNGFGVDLWRFMAGVGLGVELVTIDTYVAELAPRHMRGRAFAFNQFVMFCAVPIVACIAYLLVPRQPYGLDGWRWVVLIGAGGALVVWWIRLAVPESPRWLARHGRGAEAEAIMDRLEAKVIAEKGPLPPLGPLQSEEIGHGSFAEIWLPPYRSRTIAMSVFNFFQTIGFYGFAAWVPTLLIAKGIEVTKGLEYSFIIALANPISPLLGTLTADKMERKWQICAAAICIAVFGLLFANVNDALLIVLLGVAVTLSANWLSYCLHNYMAEVFPTRIRARAIGFVYSWSRLSAAFAGLAISYLLNKEGVNAVFIFIAFAMLMVVVSVGGFGPPTRGLALEEISH